MAMRTTEIVRELKPCRTDELTDTIDLMLDVLLDRLAAFEKTEESYRRLRLGVAFLVGLRDRLTAL
jgi:hypothetical protein